MEVGTTAKLANLIITNDPIRRNPYVKVPKSATYHDCLYLNGMWLAVGLRTDNKMTCV